MKNNYDEMIQKKQDKLNKLYDILEDTKAKIKRVESDIAALMVEKDAEQFGVLKKELENKKYNVDAILMAMQEGKIDLSAFKVNESQKNVTVTAV